MSRVEEHTLREDEANDVMDVDDSSNGAEDDETSLPGVSKPEKDKESRSPNLLENASFLSRAVFHWPYSLLQLGLQQPLEEKDLPEIMDVDSSQYNANHFDKIWKKEQELNPEKPSLHRAIIWDYLRSIWYIQPFIGLAALAKIVQAVVLGLIFCDRESRGRVQVGKFASDIGIVYSF